jgi:hypothetical protein
MSKLLCIKFIVLTIKINYKLQQQHNLFPLLLCIFSIES